MLSLAFSLREDILGEISKPPTNRDLAFVTVSFSFMLRRRLQNTRVNIFREFRGWKRNNVMLIIPLFRLKNFRYSILPGTKRSLFRSTKSIYSAKISLTYLRLTDSRLQVFLELSGLC